MVLKGEVKGVTGKDDGASRQRREGTGREQDDVLRALAVKMQSLWTLSLHTTNGATAPVGKLFRWATA